MELLRKRGEAIAQKRLVHARSEIKSALAEELSAEVRIAETGDGILVEAPRLKKQLAENSSLRDVAFLMRGIR